MPNLSTEELIAKNKLFAKQQCFTYIFSPSSNVFHTTDCRAGLSSKEISGCIYYKNNQVQRRTPCKICKPTPDMQPVKGPAQIPNVKDRLAPKKAPDKPTTQKVKKPVSVNTDYPKDCLFLFQEASGSYANGNFFKEFFQSVNADYADLKKLFRSEYGDLYYVSENTVEIAVRDDYWRFAKEDGQLVLYHNDYHVLPDYSREFADTFHVQRLTKEHNFHNMVSYICSYSWDEHVDYLKHKSNTEEMRRLKVSMMQNYQLIRDRSLIFNTYLFVDIKTEALDRMNKEFLVKPSTMSVQVPNSICNLVYCRIPKFYSKRFETIVESLKDLCLEKCKFDYIPACEQNISQDKYDKQLTKIRSDSGMLDFIPPRFIFNKNICIMAN